MVTLDFDVYSAEAADNVKQKLALFKKAVTDFVRVVNAQLNAREKIIGGNRDKTK